MATREADRARLPRHAQHTSDAQTHGHTRYMRNAPRIPDQHHHPQSTRLDRAPDGARATLPIECTHTLLHAHTRPLTPHTKYTAPVRPSLLCPVRLSVRPSQSALTRRHSSPGRRHPTLRRQWCRQRHSSVHSATLACTVPKRGPSHGTVEPTSRHAWGHSLQKRTTWPASLRRHLARRQSLRRQLARRQSQSLRRQLARRQSLRRQPARRQSLRRQLARRQRFGAPQRAESCP